MTTVSTQRAERSDAIIPVKPPAVKKGDTVGIFAPASPGNEERVRRGISELQSLGYRVEQRPSGIQQGYFSASAESRFSDLQSFLADGKVAALFALRGGYGSNYLLEKISQERPPAAKCIVGYSDLTSLQVFLWQKFHWVSLYGPMVAAGLDGGPDAPKGYDKKSLGAALSGSSSTWALDLHGEALVPGAAEGRVLGGCMTLVETSLGTPWELDTTDSILLLEDRGMKPWQVDRALMHLLQARKLQTVRGIVLGEFPECEPPVPGSPTVKEVCERLLGSLGVPIVYGAAVGHTLRPMRTVPLGIRARLTAERSGELQFLESAVLP